MGICFRKYTAILIFLSTVVLLPFPRASLAETAIESKVKAAFVVNFARFISWPEALFSEATEPLVICTVGMDLKGAAFAGIETKKIKGRSIVLKNFRSLDENMETCHLLYVKRGSNEDLQAYLEKDGTSPVVSISESDGFVALGGTIEFVKVADRLSFKINNTKAKERQLRINASLLNLAVEVY
ncbi:MAG: hypothetical protein ACI8ZB_000546 [Desulforhopalus sp.]|jgi:hypothetical protein